MSDAAKPGNRIFWFALAGLVVCWAAYLLITPPRRGPEGYLPPRLEPTSFRADFSWQLEDLQGNPVSLATHRGKAIFLNIWATWCGPCLQEMPAIERLARNQRLKDVVFLAVSEEPAQVLHAFTRDRPIEENLTILRTPSQPPDVFAPEVYPKTFLIAPDGRIAAVHAGAAQWDDPYVVDFLENLARERPEAPPDKGAP